MSENRIIYEVDNTKIEYSCLLTKFGENHIISLIITERYNRGLPITRSYKSYLSELKAHNRLFKLHLFRKHTTDCDLEENIKWWKDLIYRIIGW